ncbi:MAG: hypothetical protein KBT34_13415 [Prevotella sp.]|nr:hypothetical protein [Candidatus Prevotella equi]
MTHEYDDIINLPHHVSKVHPQMTMYQRAAQFAPFAALTGHDAAIRETARLTDRQIELGDENNEILNRKLAILRDHLKDTPDVTITFFQPDEKKSGGSYETYTGNMRVIDDYEQNIVMTDGKKISLPSILYIDGRLFDDED